MMLMMVMAMIMKMVIIQIIIKMGSLDLCVGASTYVYELGLLCSSLDLCVVA